MKKKTDEMGELIGALRGIRDSVSTLMRGGNDTGPQEGLEGGAMHIRDGVEQSVGYVSDSIDALKEALESIDSSLRRIADQLCGVTK